MKKVLIITPRFPLPSVGACEQDRLEGIKQLKRMGYDVQVIGKIFDFQKRDEEKINNFSKEFGVPVHLVPYDYCKKRSGVEKIMYFARRLFWPLYWDGSVYEYANTVTRSKMEEVMNNFQPDIVWFDYTFMLPLYKIARKYGAKIITHSLIYDPKNVLEEDGRTWKNYISSAFKTFTDWRCIRMSDYMFAIAPDEMKMYRKLGAKKIAVLPLRKLYDYLGKNSEVRDRSPLNVFFIGSSYNIPHNLRFARFIIEEIAPIVHEKYPGKFKFFITGSKLPEDLQNKCADRVSYLGYVEDFAKFLSDMDVAFIPSLSGTGMQQKIFEPIARGFPVITAKHGLGEYPFECGKEILCAVTRDEFVEKLGEVLDINKRKSLSQNALAKSVQLFSREKSDSIINTAFSEVLKIR